MGLLAHDLAVHGLHARGKQQQRGGAVELICPVRGEKAEQIKLAYQNGMDAIKKQRELEHRSWERGEGALAQLCGHIGLEELPRRIECFDNSHIRGRDTVSGMVVFIDGKKAPKEYRRFKLKLNHGDLKATQGDTGHAQIDMITSVYAHILDEDRKVNAQKFEDAFYASANPDLRTVRPPAKTRGPKEPESVSLDLEALVEQLRKSPELANTLAALLASAPSGK